jgi:hypothetical protein
MSQDVLVLISMKDDYTKALAKAERELSDLETEIAALVQRKAQLEQTISNLRSLTGVKQEERSLSDSIRLVLKATDRFLSTQQVVEKLEAFTKDVNPVSVSTILSRLAKDKEAIAGATEGGRNGYMWNPFKKD